VLLDPVADAERGGTAETLDSRWKKEEAMKKDRLARSLR
jgi:hypothetical protein